MNYEPQSRESMRRAGIEVHFTGESLGPLTKIVGLIDGTFNEVGMAALRVRRRGDTYRVLTPGGTQLGGGYKCAEPTVMELYDWVLDKCVLYGVI